MIIELRMKNCFTFSNEIVFSMEADMRSKKLSSNVHRNGSFNVLKTAGIYGPNNVGKTCFVKAIKVIKNVMLNNRNNSFRNIFIEDSISSLGISFLYENSKYSYDFQYDNSTEMFVYEKFSEIRKDHLGNESEKKLLIRDKINNHFYFENKNVEKILPLISQNNILIHLVDTSQFKELDEIKQIFIQFASRLDIISMNNIPIQKTIDLLKNKDNLQDKVIHFIKNADLDLDGILYADLDQINIKKAYDDKPDEEVLNISDKFMDQLRMISVYKGKPVPTLLFDSTGTKKIIALSSYIIEALEYGRILIVDELDSSFHFKLTRAIVAMFNNELNKLSQLIFTVHDINLMDCKKLFRKEQIWFLNKDKDGVYMYSLGDFTAQDGVRDTSDIIEKYRKGLLGALPEPTLINTLLHINKKENQSE